MASRTIFIPKQGFEHEPSKYRPITISYILVRGLHRILARRIEQAIPIDERHKGFRTNVDGCRDNIFLLDTIMKHQHRNFKPLYIASLDVAKAFPSISHKALILSLKSFGVPISCLNYISYVYENSYTILFGQGWRSAKIHPEWGVRQGDPLSSPLFNIVTHRMLQTLPADVGIKLGATNINATVFVDDLNLYASTPRGLQVMINKVTQFLGECGLTINTDKSFTLGFKPSGKQKISTMDITTEFKIANRSLRKMSRTDPWTYLGVQFTWTGRKNIAIKESLMVDREINKSTSEASAETFCIQNHGDTEALPSTSFG